MRSEQSQGRVEELCEELRGGGASVYAPLTSDVDESKVVARVKCDTAYLIHENEN